MPFTTTIRNWDANLHNFKGLISISGSCWAEISTMFSFPPLKTLSYLCWLSFAAIWMASWLRQRPTRTAGGLGRLPASPTDMCSSKRWMNNAGLRPGGCFFISRTSVFMGLLQAPQQVTPPSPKICPTVYRNSDVCFRLTAKTPQN